MSRSFRKKTQRRDLCVGRAIHLFREPINGLWIGKQLTTIQRLSIASFLHHGHPFRLYVYDHVSNVPTGTTMCDAERIIPASQIFAYRRGRGTGSLAGFSDLFRYKLLLEQGGWWVDVDLVALRPFEFDRPTVFGWEDAGKIATGAICGACGSELLSRCYEEALRRGHDIDWGDIGPKLFTMVVQDLNLTDAAENMASFYPIPWKRWAWLISPGYRPPPTSYAIHLWYHMWIWNQMDPEGNYPKDSIYERLKQHYLAEPEEGFNSTVARRS